MKRRLHLATHSQNPLRRIWILDVDLGIARSLGNSSYSGADCRSCDGTSNRWNDSVRALASSLSAKTLNGRLGAVAGDRSCRSDSILVIILIIFLLGGFSGRFGGYGYGYGHGGVGVIGVILIILLVSLLMGRL